jgi:hypothetical protein
MSFCKFCGYDVLGPCDNARLAERCRSLRSTCGFCGHDVYLACDDAEKAKSCRTRRRMGVCNAPGTGRQGPMHLGATLSGAAAAALLRRWLPARSIVGPLDVAGTGVQALAHPRSWAGKTRR